MCIAEVVSVAAHPKADRLRVVQVDAGGAAPVTVVTNALEVEEGMKVVFAVSGVGQEPPGMGVRVHVGTACTAWLPRAPRRLALAALLPAARGLHHPQRHGD